MQTHGKQSLHRAVPRGSQTHRVTYSYPRFLLGFEMSYYVTAVLPTQELNSFAHPLLQQQKAYFWIRRSGSLSPVIHIHPQQSACSMGQSTGGCRAFGAQFHVLRNQQLQKVPFQLTVTERSEQNNWAALPAEWLSKHRRQGLKDGLFNLSSKFVPCRKLGLQRSKQQQADPAEPSTDVGKKCISWASGFALYHSGALSTLPTKRVCFLITHVLHTFWDQNTKRDVLHPEPNTQHQMRTEAARPCSPQAVPCKVTMRPLLPNVLLLLCWTRALWIKQMPSLPSEDAKFKTERVMKPKEGQADLKVCFILLRRTYSMLLLWKLNGWNLVRGAVLTACLQLHVLQIYGSKLCWVHAQSATKLGTCRPHAATLTYRLLLETYGIDI